MKQLEWTMLLDEQFWILKEHFNKWPLRSYPLFGEDAEKFKVRANFSSNNLGTVLEQVQGEQKCFIGAIDEKRQQGKRIIHLQMENWLQLFMPSVSGNISYAISPFYYLRITKL